MPALDRTTPTESASSSPCAAAANHPCGIAAGKRAAHRVAAPRRPSARASWKTTTAVVANAYATAATVVTFKRTPISPQSIGPEEPPAPCVRLLPARSLGHGAEACRFGPEGCATIDATASVSAETPTTFVHADKTQWSHLHFSAIAQISSRPMSSPAAFDPCGRRPKRRPAQATRPLVASPIRVRCAWPRTGTRGRPGSGSTKVTSAGSPSDSTIPGTRSRTATVAPGLTRAFSATVLWVMTASSYSSGLSRRVHDLEWLALHRHVERGLASELGEFEREVVPATLTPVLQPEVALAFGRGESR